MGPLQSKIQNQSSKIQNQNSKIQTPKIKNIKNCSNISQLCLTGLEVTGVLRPGTVDGAAPYKQKYAKM